MKTCTLCTRSLPLTSFAWRRDRESYTTRCKQCLQANAREYWATKKAVNAPDPKAKEARELHGTVMAWRGPTDTSRALAWRV